MASAALQGRDPDLARLEVDGDAGPGHREGVGEGLDGRLGVRADRGEEALALAGGQVLPAPGVDEGERAVGQGPKGYVTL